MFPVPWSAFSFASRNKILRHKELHHPTMGPKLSGMNPVNLPGQPKKHSI